MSWHTGRLACFDLETTGIESHRDRIVTAAIVEVGGGQPTRESNWLVNPGIPIPPEASAVHHVTDDDVAGGMDAGQAVYEIAEHLTRLALAGIPIVGHNVGGYDLTMLWAESIRHEHRDHVTALEDIASGDAGHVVDTMVIEKHLDSFRPGSPETARGRRTDDACGKHTLVDCCRLWGVPLSEDDAHGAAADALAAGRLAWRLATDPERFAQYDFKPTLRINPGTYPLPQLHAWQQQTYATEAARFQSYKRGEQRRKPDDVDPNFVAATTWPLQNPPADWSPDQIPAPREEDAA